jgi:hypothetical protein
VDEPEWPGYQSKATEQGLASDVGGREPEERYAEDEGEEDGRERYEDAAQVEQPVSDGEEENIPGSNARGVSAGESGGEQHWGKAGAVVGQMDMEIEEEVQGVGSHGGDAPDINTEEQLWGHTERCGEETQNTDEVPMFRVHDGGREVLPDNAGQEPAEGVNDEAGGSEGDKRKTKRRRIVPRCRWNSYVAEKRVGDQNVSKSQNRGGQFIKGYNLNIDLVLPRHDGTLVAVEVNGPSHKGRKAAKKADAEKEAAILKAGMEYTRVDVTTRDWRRCVAELFTML